MEGHGDKQAEVNAQGGDAGSHHLRLTVEDPDQKPGEQHGGGPEDSGVTNRHRHAEADGAPDAAVSAGAVVVPGDRLGAVGEPLHRHEEHLPQGVDDGHHAYVQVAAVCLERGVAHHLHQTVGEIHEEAGQAQGHDGFHPPGAQRQIPQAEPQDGLPPGEEFQYPHGGAALGDHGGQRRAPHPHVQGEDEDRIQHDVDHRPQAHGHHPGAAEALRRDEGIHPQADHDKDGPQQIDGHVRLGIGIGGVTGAEQVEQGMPEQQEHPCDSGAENQQKGEGVAHDPLGLFLLALAPVDGAQGGAPRAAQVGKAHHDGDDGQRQPQARQSQMPGEPPQVDAVHHAVQHVDELGSRHGQRQRNDVAGNAADGKIVLLACHGFVLLLTVPFCSRRFQAPAGAVPPAALPLWMAR